MPHFLNTSATYIVTVNNACITGQVTDSPCQGAAGAIDITVQGGNPPYTYSWSNGATTEDITGLAPGPYTVTVTDASGTTFIRTFWVNASNINVTTTVTQPSCTSPTGSIQTSVSGGMAPYSYLWNTGATTTGLSGLAPGGYSVTITDANGCPRHLVEILNAPDSCFSVIEGIAYSDLNQNCIQDANEPGLPYMFIDLSPGGAVFTDQNGYYSFQTGTGSFTVDISPRPYIAPSCPATGSHTATFSALKQDTTLDFAMDVQTVQDLRVALAGGPARPGATRNSYVVVYNDGSVPMGGSLEWVHDPIFDFLNSFPAPAQYDPNTQTADWTVPTLQPGQHYGVSILTYCDTSNALGTPWTESATILPIAGDTTPGNNVAVRSDTVRGAFDPNDKQVYPAGIREPGYILPSEDLLEYKIRFQNTGTDTAFYVVIRDTIDADLEISSLRPSTQSHSYTLAVDEDSILVFTFANIMLPDSGTDLAGSQGHVSYSLRHNGTLSPGTVIENSAAIYFDFNAPIITNTVVNTVFTYPVVGLGNDTTICEGQALEGAILEAGMPPYDFTWSTGDTDPGNPLGISQTTVTQSGTYSVSVTDAFGFMTTDAIMVTAAPLPDAGFSFTQTGKSYNFTAPSSANTTWTWDFGDGNTAAGMSATTHVFDQKGTYTVTLIASNSCGSDTSTQVIDFATDLEADEFTGSVKVRPNPFLDQTVISFDNRSGSPVSVILYDLQGRMIQTYRSNGNHVILKRNNLPSGLYLFEIRGPDVYYGRLVME